MQAITMTYKGFCFDANPAYIKAEYSKNIASKSVLFKSAKQQEISFKSAKSRATANLSAQMPAKKHTNLLRCFSQKAPRFCFLTICRR